MHVRHGIDSVPQPSVDTDAMQAARHADAAKPASRTAVPLDWSKTSERRRLTSTTASCKKHAITAGRCMIIGSHDRRLCTIMGCCRIFAKTKRQRRSVRTVEYKLLLVFHATPELLRIHAGSVQDQHFGVSNRPDGQPKAVTKQLMAHSDFRCQRPRTLLPE